ALPFWPAPAAGRRPADAVGALWRRWRLRRADALVLGGKGAAGAAGRRWERELAGLARRVRVMGDLELAHRSAFSEGPGVLLIAGTGSAALARGRRWARAGGRGPLLGDEGSGFWIGRRWLDARPDAEALRLARRPDAVAAVAALARPLLSRAAAGRPPERRIAREAAGHLAALARRAARDARLGPRAPLCVHGGLARSPYFSRVLAGALGRGFAARRPARRPEDHAARLAVELVSSRRG
ncbi:hypothetical protein EPO15_16765, partial [bacterium]